MHIDDKKLLVSFKESYIDKFLIVGKLYTIQNVKNIFVKNNILSTINGKNDSIDFDKPIFILKIDIIESINYFNIGPAILITCFQDTKKHNLYVFPKQIKNKKDFHISFLNSFIELT